MMAKINEAFESTEKSQPGQYHEEDNEEAKTDEASTSSSTVELATTVSRAETPDKEVSSGDDQSASNADGEDSKQYKKNISYVMVKGPAGDELKVGLKSDNSQVVHVESSDISETLSTSERDSSGHFSIDWSNLDYVVESKWYKLAKQRKPILANLSGTIRSGELTAILGPSGAGKSTLIDCLLGKKSSGLRGKTRVMFNDSQLEQERRRKRPLKIATIPQEDHLLDTLTVMETFMFASKIKNAHLAYEGQDDDTRRQSSSKRREAFNHFANVQRVIQQLNLSACATLRCAKLSGGQYKRVSIGQELLSRPDIMILDEPTSGLDSVTCYQTVNALRQLIDSSPYPMAIVATIHQPDVDVFSLFHKAYVLASGGRAIYEGPTTGILDTVALGLEIAEARNARRKQAALAAPKMRAEAPAPDSRPTPSGDLSQLRRQLGEKHERLNPARLIVELAANEYGFEITTVLNELQRRDDSGNCNESQLVGPLANSSRSESSTTIASTSSPLSSTSSQSLVPSGDPEHSTRATARRQSAASTPTPAPPAFDYSFHDPTRRRADLDQLLHLVSANMNQRRSPTVYAKHLYYHTHRSWITILRDPMMFTVQVALHVLVPLLISYAFQGHRGEACPLVGPLDVVEEAYRQGNILDDLNEELRVVFENMGYMFFQLYVIIFAGVCATSLTYPLAMHVLLKEYRNGWYSMSSYFLGRTLADLPMPTCNVVMAMAISYHLTGQALSPYAWRFVSVSLLTVLATLVAQTQGLMFGALLMNAPSSAVFAAPASTAPLVVVSGFLLRIQSLPWTLQVLSKFSYFTHLLNGFVVSRYGFGTCPCSESDFELDESRQVPQQARAIIDLWVDTFSPEYPGANATRTDLVGKLVGTITRAKMFNHEMTDCSQVKPFTMLDYNLNDEDLKYCFIALIAMLIFCRWLTYFVLTWKIRSAL